MEHAFGLKIPRTLEEVCDLNQIALLIYDMQVGIVSQIRNGNQITARIELLLSRSFQVDRRLGRLTSIVG